MPVGGTFDGALSVTINCSTSEALLYYLTNGVDPYSWTSPAKLYLSPITVAGNRMTNMIKAFAEKSGPKLVFENRLGRGGAA